MQSTDLITPLAIGSPIALSGDKNIPSQTASGTDTSSISAGFLPITSQPLDDGGIAPERIDFNGMFYLSTDQRFYLQNGGVITYDTTVATAIGGYPKGAVLDYIDSNDNYCKVISLVENNQYDFVTTPSYINGTYWDYASLKTDLSNMNPTQNAKDTIFNWNIPNYANAITVYNRSGAGSFNIDWNGWLAFDLYCNQNSARYQIGIDGVRVGATASDEGDRAAGIVMVKSGSVVSWNGSQSIVLKKVPYLGG